MWPDYPWQQDRAKFTKKREVEYKEEGKMKAPLEDEAMRAIRWYWNQLRWRDEAEEVEEGKGISWKELAIDCWAATGYVVRCPRSKGRTTGAQQMTEAFAKASRYIEAEEKKAGGWLWTAKAGRTSSLAPFGQRAAVAGIKSQEQASACEECGGRAGALQGCGDGRARRRGGEGGEVAS